MSGPPTIRGAPFDAADFTREVTSRRFLGRTLMVVSRPASVGHILLGRAEAYVRPTAAARVLAPPIGGGLFLADGAEWRRQRRMLAPSFAPRENQRFVRHAAAFVERSVAELAAEAPGEADVFAAVQSLSLAVAAQSLLSIDIAPWTRQIRAMVVGYSSGLARPGMLDFLLPATIPSLRDLRRRGFRRRWMRLVATIVADRISRPAAAPDLFDVIRAGEVDRTRLEQQVATLLVTGSETTGAALFWSLALLADHPDMQARVAAEAAGLDLGPQGAFAALPELRVARAVVQEAMRLYPPAFSIVRQALDDDDAAGVAIRKGAIVQTAPFVLHRHRLLWERPDAFEPERFLGGARPPDRFAYLPFGIGPRACIAAQFAQLESVLAVASLVRELRITPVSDRPVTPVAQITLQPENPPRFRIERRHAAHAVNARPAPAACPNP